MFVVENQRASMNYEGERREKYKSLKLEGILDTPVNLCITCDRSRTGPDVLGCNTLIEADLFSTCCAVQNLWLAAKSEGIGVGWVSILAHESLKDLLKLPESVIPVAYLCVSYVSEFLLEPELETVGWQKRSTLRQQFIAINGNNSLLGRCAFVAQVQSLGTIPPRRPVGSSQCSTQHCLAFVRTFGDRSCYLPINSYRLVAIGPGKA